MKLSAPPRKTLHQLMDDDASRDLEMPGGGDSFFPVSAAYTAGRITRAQYEALAEAAHDSKGQAPAGSQSLSHPVSVGHGAHAGRHHRHRGRITAMALKPCKRCKSAPEALPFARYCEACLDEITALVRDVYAVIDYYGVTE